MQPIKSVPALCGPLRKLWQHSNKTKLRGKNDQMDSNGFKRVSRSNTFSTLIDVLEVAVPSRHSARQLKFIVYQSDVVSEHPCLREDNIPISWESHRSSSSLSSWFPSTLSAAKLISSSAFASAVSLKSPRAKLSSIWCLLMSSSSISTSESSSDDRCSQSSVDFWNSEKAGDRYRVSHKWAKIPQNKKWLTNLNGWWCSVSLYNHGSFRNLCCKIFVYKEPVIPM